MGIYIVGYRREGERGERKRDRGRERETERENQRAGGARRGREDWSHGSCYLFGKKGTGQTIITMIPVSEQSRGRLGLKVLRKDLRNSWFCDYLPV